jgi:hypothetical protein
MYTHTYMHTCIHTVTGEVHTHMTMGTNMRVHAHILYIHTHIHTCIHTCSHGRGTYAYDNGDKYEGTYSNGLRQTEPVSICMYVCVCVCMYVDMCM